MTRQPVSGAAGNDGERRVRVNQGTPHLIDRSVSSDGNDNVHPFLDSAARQFLGMTGMFCLKHTWFFKDLSVREFKRQLRHAPFALRAGNGIDDIDDGLFHEPLGLCFEKK